LGFRLKLNTVDQRNRGRSHELTGGATLNRVDTVRSRSNPTFLPNSERFSNCSSRPTTVESP
jgi:hypothetical protein